MKRTLRPIGFEACAFDSHLAGARGSSSALGDFVVGGLRQSYFLRSQHLEQARGNKLASGAIQHRRHPLLRLMEYIGKQHDPLDPPALDIVQSAGLR